MQRRSGRARALLAALALVAAVGAVPASADVTEVAVPSLWVGDDVVKVTANVALTGERLTSFATPNTALSSVAVDPIDGTLWGANEAAGGGFGKLVNYDTDGTVIAEFPAQGFGARSLEGVAVATDGSLWVVDDPDDGATPDSIHHVDRAGAAILGGPFPLAVAGFPLGPDSPQDVAYDPFDDTLWITDNGADAVYNVDPADGTVVRYFTTTSQEFAEALGNTGGITNPQGITVEAPGVLWLTSRGTGHLLRVQVGGPDAAPVVAVTDVLDVGTAIPGAINPTAIAYSTSATAQSTRAALGAIRAALASARASLDDHDADRVGKAVEELDEAIDDGRVWTSSGEPTAAEGKRALERMRDALDELADVDQPSPTVVAAESALLRLSRDTAVANLQTAQDLAADPDHIAEGFEKLAKGDEDAAAGKLRDAADEYKKAWEEATKAILDGTGLLPANASLWVVDDGLPATGNVTLTGRSVTSFTTPNTAISSVAIDPVDGTLWGANEGGRNSAGKLVNYDTTGAVQREILAGAFGGRNPEGVDLAPDGTLWVVDDPNNAPEREPTVYHLGRDGTRMSSFTVASFAPGATSPQDIAYDPYDDTLWITDNSVDRVFHVTTGGVLIDSIATTTGPFVTGTTPAGVINPQGITVESAFHVWVSSRDTGTIHRIAKTGSVGLQVLPASALAPGAGAPVGIAFSATIPTPTVGDDAGTRAELATLRDTLAATGALLTGDDAKRVADAVKELDGRLTDDAVWTEDGGLTEDHGKDALDAIKKALGELADVKADQPAVAAVEADLLALSRETAEGRLTLASVLAPASDHVGHAQEELTKGDEEAAKGDLERAADKYKKAWEEATQAVAEAA